MGHGEAFAALALLGVMFKIVATVARHLERRYDIRKLEIGAQVGTNSEGVDALRTEVDALREELAEVQERLDFTERVLARSRAAQLPGSGNQGV